MVDDERIELQKKQQRVDLLLFLFLNAANLQICI